jgi:hypothetical protein
VTPRKKDGGLGWYQQGEENGTEGKSRGVGVNLQLVGDDVRMPISERGKR